MPRPKFHRPNYIAPIYRLTFIVVFLFTSFADKISLSISEPDTVTSLSTPTKSGNIKLMSTSGSVDGSPQSIIIGTFS
uniref:Putative secreted protein n=1 Tax=Xenopsylla cheopis TaxID=163159 RepID=A0A6M2E336_XENCH